MLLDLTISMPAGSGYRQFMHYAQLANSGKSTVVSDKASIVYDIIIFISALRRSIPEV